MKQVDEYMSPGKYKDALMVNDLAYHNLNEYEDKISDSSKHVEAIKDPITDTPVRITSVGTSSVDPAVIRVGIIGQGEHGITEGMIHRVSSIICSNVITDVLKNSSKMIFKSNTFPLNPFNSQTLMITSQN